MLYNIWIDKKSGAELYVESSKFLFHHVKTQASEINNVSLKEYVVLYATY